MARWHGNEIGQNSFSKPEDLLKYLSRLSVRLMQRFIAFSINIDVILLTVYCTFHFLKRELKWFFLDKIYVHHKLSWSMKLVQFCSQLLRLFAPIWQHRQSYTRRTIFRDSRSTFVASPAFWFACDAPGPHRRPPRRGCGKCSCAWECPPAVGWLYPARSTSPSCLSPSPRLARVSASGNPSIPETARIRWIDKLARFPIVILENEV